MILHTTSVCSGRHLDPLGSAGSAVPLSGLLILLGRGSSKYPGPDYWVNVKEFGPNFHCKETLDCLPWSHIGIIVCKFFNSNTD